MYKRGRIWWAAGFDRHGQRWQRSTKQTDERAAKQVAAQLESELADEANRPRDEACTLEVACSELLKFAQTRRTPETIDFLETKARHVLRVLGRHRLCISITPERTSKFAQKRLAEGAHPHTVQKEIRVLLQALRRAAKLRLFKPDIELRELKPDEVKDAYQPRERWLTEEEYQLLLAELDPVRGGRTRRRRLPQKTKEKVTRANDVVRLGKISGREQWNEAIARTVLFAWARSAEPMRAFARTHGFDVKRILWWRDKLGLRDELDQLAAKASAVLDERALEEDRRDYFIVLCQTGARLKELYRIRAEHIDLKRSSLFLDGTKTKNAPRAVPITPAVEQVLERRLKRFGKAPLFPIWDKVQRDLYAACLRIERRQNPNDVRLKVQNPKGNPIPKRDRVRPLHPFDPVTPNDLRRTYASWLAQSGVPVLHAINLMGHESAEMLQRVYARFAPKHLHDAVALLPEGITGASSPLRLVHTTR